MLKWESLKVNNLKTTGRLKKSISEHNELPRKKVTQT